MCRQFLKSSSFSSEVLRNCKHMLWRPKTKKNETFENCFHIFLGVLGICCEHPQIFPRYFSVPQDSGFSLCRKPRSFSLRFPTLRAGPLFREHGNKFYTRSKDMKTAHSFLFQIRWSKKQHPSCNFAKLLPTTTQVKSYKMYSLHYSLHWLYTMIQKGYNMRSFVCFIDLGLQVHPCTVVVLHNNVRLFNN